MQGCCCNRRSDGVFKYLHLHHTWLVIVAPSAAATAVYGGASRTRGTPSSGVNIQHPRLCQITHYRRHRQHTRRPSPRCTMHDAQDVPSTEHMHYAMYVSTHIIASSQMLRRRRSAVSLSPPCAAPPGLLRKLSE